MWQTIVESVVIYRLINLEQMAVLCVP